MYQSSLFFFCSTFLFVRVSRVSDFLGDNTCESWIDVYEISQIRNKETSVCVRVSACVGVYVCVCVCSYRCVCAGGHRGGHTLTGGPVVAGFKSHCVATKTKDKHHLGVHKR